MVPTYLLAEVANRLVILVQNDANLVHQTNLLGIVTVQLSGTGVDIREKAQDARCGDGLHLCNGGRC